MYRARVEAVSGLQVKAGGKWLTCIGNRVVRAGDMVWTDGRCVYGHDREPQTPLVIVNPEPKEAIPIQIGNNAYTYRKSLKFNCETSGVTLLTNDKRQNLYFSDNSKILATNVDERGNVYSILETNSTINIMKNGNIVNTIDNKSGRNSSTSSFYIPPGSKIETSFNSVPINKPDDPGFPPALSLEWFHLAYTQYLTKCEITPYGGGNITLVSREDVSSFCDWAFIEDENNWAVVVTETTETLRESVHAIGTWFNCQGSFFGTQGELTMLAPIHNEESFSTKTYLIDKRGKNLLFDASKTKGDYIEGVLNEKDTWNWYIANWLGIELMDVEPYEYPASPLTYNTENFVGTKFPMQDGFFFVVNSVSPANPATDDVVFSDFDDLISAPGIMNVTIYTSDSTPIFTGTFAAVSYIAACKLGSRKFLLEVKSPLGGSKGKGFTNDAGDWIASQMIRQGLYLIEDGELTTLQTGNIANQCLRPMKRYKHWWNRIQLLDTGGD